MEHIYNEENNVTGRQVGVEKEIDQERIKAAVREILIAVGDNPDRAGLIETPKRVAKMYAEILEGMLYTNEEIAQKYDKCFEEDPNNNNMVLVKDITCFSLCEHHMAIMMPLKISVAYIPKNGRVIGLSKVARIAEMCCKRLQLQERIGEDIADVIHRVTRSDDIFVHIEGVHSCLVARGVKNVTSSTITNTLKGAFYSDYELRKEVLSML